MKVKQQLLNGLLNISVLLMASESFAHDSIPANISSSTEQLQVRPSTVLFKIPADLSSQELKSLNSLLNSQGLVSSRTLEGSKIVIATFAHKGKETAIANILKHSSLVEFAEPDYMVAPSAEPNDPSFGNQWHHTNVNSPDAWNVTTGSTSVLTAVCDTGFDATHPDLADNLRLDLAYNAQDGSNYIYDANGHGTGTAGTLGAVGNNAIGVAGINWDVEIIPVRIAISDSNSSAYISTMATCIEYAADNGARIVNLSYGGIQYSTIDAAAQYLRSKNGLLFMSAGNDGQEFSYPDYTSFVGVGATDENDNRASFSSWGNYVDVTAPGVRILTTYPDNRYVYYSGTSFSSPLTAGIAALMVAANPSITVSEIENGLFSTAADIGVAGDDNVFGHGLVNSAAAVQYALNLGNLQAPTAAISTSNTSVPFGTAISFSGAASSDTDGTISSYQWSLGDGTSASLMDVTHTYAQAGSYQVELTVTDNDGLTDSATTTVQVTTDLPTAIIDPMVLAYNINDLVSFSGAGSYDTDGTITSYQWTFGDGAGGAGSLVNHSYTSAGTYTATLTVTDNAGAMNSTSVNVVISDPYIVNAPSNLAAQTDGLAVSLSWSDNSNNEESFVVERGVKYRGRITFTEVATLAANSTEYIDNVDEAGSYRYRVIAKSSFDQTASDTITVSVENSTPEPGNLAAPTNLQASASGGMVTLNWIENTSSETGFYIERGKKVKGKVSFAKIGQVSQDVTTFSDDVSGLSGTYVYRVQAFNATETSAYSNTVELRLK